MDAVIQPWLLERHRQMWCFHYQRHGREASPCLFRVIVLQCFVFLYTIEYIERQGGMGILFVPVQRVAVRAAFRIFH